MRRSCLMRGACVALLPVVLAALVGCVSLPEVGPFVDATLQLRSGIVASGRVVEAEMRQAEEIVGEQSKDKGEELKAITDKLHSAWEARVKAADALCAYADSLREIVEAGQKGGEAAGSLMSSVKGLAEAAGIVLPGADVMGVVTDTGKFIYAQIALIRASKSLEEALVRTQPAVERISEIIAEDCDDLGKEIQAASRRAVLARTKQYNTEISARNGLLKKQKDLYRKLSEALLQEEDKKGEWEWNADMERLLKVGKLIEAMEIWYQDIRQEDQLRKKRLVTGGELIQSAGQAVVHWAGAHKQLVHAVRDKRSVNPAALLQAAAEIGDLIRRMREL
jgi:hypothetical protein